MLSEQISYEKKNRNYAIISVNCQKF